MALTIKPIRSLESTSARLLNFLYWLVGLTVLSLTFYLLKPLAAGIPASVSLVILTYLLVRRNIIEIRADIEKKSLEVHYLPWFGKRKTATYPISSQTELLFIPANIKVPFQQPRWTGRYKLVVWAPREYKLEFFSSDFAVNDLEALFGFVSEIKNTK